MNEARPVIEESSLLFRYLWSFRGQDSKNQAYSLQQRAKWNAVLENLAQQHGFRPKEIPGQIDLDASFMDDKIQELLQSGPGSEDFASPLAYRGAIEMLHRDTHHQAIFNTIRYGIPNQLRIQYWQDILKVPFLKQAEESILRRNYAGTYQNNLTVYDNLVLLADEGDCLAFRQIDEDVNSFKVPDNFKGDLRGNHRDRYIREDMTKIRKIFRALAIWSKGRKIGGEPFKFGLTLGLYKIAHRLLQLGTEEETFWVLNATIRAIPRMFAMEHSSLEGHRASMLRNELTYVKSVLEQNLPEVSNKFKQIGLSVECLIYESMTSFYAYDFPSEVLFRVWDMLFFAMGTGTKSERKRAFWYILSPAYFVMKQKKTELLHSQTPKQLMDAYRNGFAATYNPDSVITELNEVVKTLFLTKNKITRA